jgi:carboxypeptidase T
MKKIIYACILTFVLFSVSLQAQKYSKVKIYLNNNGLTKLGSLGIPLEGEYTKNTSLVTEMSENDIAKLTPNGFIYDILIDDMTAYYQDRNLHPEKYKTESTVRSGSCASTSNWPTPAHFVLGSMGGFLTYTEMLAQLDSMFVHYPNLITAKQQVSTMTSIEGRKLYYVKISKNPNIDETEPKVLYSALTHAREPMGMQQLIFYMWYLMENYSTNPDIQHLLDNTELFFIPIVNVDGYEYNHTTNSTGGGTWRKNRRNNGDGTFGIDLNRNYGYQWGYDNVGSSPTTSDDTYRGTAGFSEPETQIMKWFCEHHAITTAIDYHTYSNMLIYPWCYSTNLLTPDSILYKTYSKLMTVENGYIYGNANQTVGYTANGGSVDWFYGEQSTKGKMICWSPEAGDANDGFWPLSTRIVDIAKTNILQNLYVARFAGKYAIANDGSPIAISSQNGYFKFDLQRLGLLAATFTVSVQPITSNIQTVGSSKVYSSMNVLDIKNDSISYTLSSSIQNGEFIKYLLTVDNGLYTTSDTITKIYGTPAVLFTDNCSTSTNWTLGGWGICTSQYHTAPSSIADSPVGNYANNTNKTIVLNSTINLSGAAVATLNFWTKWAIEAGYDYVQVKASTNGGTTWTPLCGKYTKPGNSNQVLDSPLYDGTQNTWVQESIDLADYLGQTIKLCFTIVSDAYTTADGYYFDDVSVTKINAAVTAITESIPNDAFISDPMPNPVENTTILNYNIPESSVDPILTVYNEIGQVFVKKTLGQTKGSVTIDMTGFAKGLYYVRVYSEGKIDKVKKLVVL